MAGDTPDKGRHLDFRLGWIELVQILQEALGRLEVLGLLPLYRGTKGRFR